MTERDGPMTPKGFNTLIHRIGERAGMLFPVHPHMLRHACGYALANAGHDTRALQAWLGHENIEHTVRYTELACGGLTTRRPVCFEALIERALEIGGGKLITPNLGGHENILALDVGGTQPPTQSFSNLALVAIALGGINIWR
jgi:hypothetical protein